MKFCTTCGNCASTCHQVHDSCSLHISGTANSLTLQIRVQDNVKAQHKLVTEKFGIRTLVLVLGWSMGAGQSFQWAVRYLCNPS